MKEIYSEILKQIPDIIKIDKDKLDKLINSKVDLNTLVLFLNNMGNYLNDYKLLRNYFSGIQVNFN